MRKAQEGCGLTTMLGLDGAFDRLLQLHRPVRSEQIPVAQALGRITTAAVSARASVPPFARAMMDGYAVRAESARRGARLRRVGCVLAGDESAGEVHPGEAVRIMTGAPLPLGADSVLRFEWCEDDGEDEVIVLRSIREGESVQPAGDDARAGQVIVPSGTRLSARHLAACHGFGVPEVSVAVRPTAAIVITGSELVANPQQPLRRGQIYSTNDAFLASALLEDGVDITSVQTVADDASAIRAAVTNLSGVDYLVLSGGISKGDADHVPNVLADLGITPVLEKVWMRPGTPLLAGLWGETVVFALSGNPAACLIQFEVLVRPVIRRSLGWLDTPFPASGALTRPLNLKPVKHTRVLRARGWIESGRVWVDTATSQSPGVLSSLADANCLVRVDDVSCPPGTVVPLRWLHPGS